MERTYTEQEVITLMKSSIKRGDDLRCNIDRIAVGFMKEDDSYVKDLLNPDEWINKQLNNLKQ